MLELYSAVGWTAYTAAPDVLKRALACSATVVVATVRDPTPREPTVRDPTVHDWTVHDWTVASAASGERVVGLARVVSDGETICYLQDVLVHPSAQRIGLGTRLVEAVLEPYADVRQKVLLTDDDAGQRAFYQALGYSAIEGTALRAFTRFD